MKLYTYMNMNTLSLFVSWSVKKHWCLIMAYTFILFPNVAESRSYLGSLMFTFHKNWFEFRRGCLIKWWMYLAHFNMLFVIKKNLFRYIFFIVLLSLACADLMFIFFSVNSGWKVLHWIRWVSLLMLHFLFRSTTGESSHAGLQIAS